MKTGNNNYDSSMDNNRFRYVADITRRNQISINYGSVYKGRHGMLPLPKSPEAMGDVGHVRVSTIDVIHPVMQPSYNRQYKGEYPIAFQATIERLYAWKRAGGSG